jgi:chorismate mutase
MEKDGLAQLRIKIDEIDSQLIEALASRMDIVREIGRLKRETGAPAKDDARWDQVLRNAKEKAAAKGVPNALVDDIYTAIHRAALEIETDKTA